MEDTSMFEGYMHLLVLGSLIFQGFCEPACPAEQINKTIHVCRSENVTSESVYIDTDGSPENYNGSCLCTVQKADFSNKDLPITIKSRSGPIHSERNSTVFTIHSREFPNLINDSIESGLYKTKDYIYFTRIGPYSESTMCLSIHIRSTYDGPRTKIRVVCDGIGPATPNVSFRPSKDSSYHRNDSTQTPVVDISELSTHASMDRTSNATSDSANDSIVRTTVTTKHTKALLSDDMTLVFIVVGCVFGIVIVVATSLAIILCKRKSRRLKSWTTHQSNHEQAAPESNYFSTENRNYVPAEVCTFRNQKTSAEEQDVLLHVRGNSLTLPDDTYAEIGETLQQDKCAYAQVCKGTNLKRATETKDESRAINEDIAAESVYNITTATPTMGVTNTPNDNIYKTCVVEDDYHHLHEEGNPKITSNNIYDVTHKP